MLTIITLFKQYLNIIIAVAIASTSFYLASVYYNHKIDKINNEYSTYRLTTEKNIENQKASILADQNKIKDENLALINKLKDTENDKYKQITALKKNNNDLKSSIANGSSSLYINAKCTATANNQGGKTEITNSSSLDDGKTAKAVIDSRDAAAIIEITNKADGYKSQLDSLQDWVNQLVLENNK